jgi:hypothetical protein
MKDAVAYTEGERIWGYLCRRNPHRIFLGFPARRRRAFRSEIDALAAARMVSEGVKGRGKVVSAERGWYQIPPRRGVYYTPAERVSLARKYGRRERRGCPELKHDA